MDGEQDWTKHTTVKKIINMGSTIEIPIVGLSKDQFRYYVKMPRIPTTTNPAFVIELKNMVEKLAQLSLDEIAEFKFFESSTQVALAQRCHGLLSLPHLPTRRTSGKKPLVDYSQSHVVTLEEYLMIMRQKATHREAVEHHIKENIRKEKQVRKTLTMLTAVEKLAKRKLVKQQ
jgi:hypothetical protein